MIPPRTGANATEGREAGAVEDLPAGRRPSRQPPVSPGRSTSRTSLAASARGWRSSSARSSSGLVLLLVPPVRALRRRVRLRRAAVEPRRLILATYEVFTERAAGIGLGRDPGETLNEYRRK